MQAAIDKAKELVEKDAGDDELKSATEELLAAIQAYEQAAGAAQQPSSEQQAAADQGDDVIDADFKPAD